MGQKLTKRRLGVDERYLRPQGLYTSSIVDLKKLKKQIVEQKLAPCYPGVELVEGDNLEECPICFLNYPVLNVSLCCNKRICTECFLQVRGNVSERSCPCPFCKAPNYSVAFHGPLTDEERAREKHDAELVQEAKLRALQEAQLNAARPQVERSEASPPEEPLPRVPQVPSETAHSSPGEVTLQEVPALPIIATPFMASNLPSTHRGLPLRAEFRPYSTGVYMGRKPHRRRRAERQGWRIAGQFGDHLPAALLAELMGNVSAAEVDLDELMLMQGVWASLKDSCPPHGQLQPDSNRHSHTILDTCGSASKDAKPSSPSSITGHSSLQAVFPEFADGLAEDSDQRFSQLQRSLSSDCSSSEDTSAGDGAVLCFERRSEKSLGSCSSRITPTSRAQNGCLSSSTRESLSSASMSSQEDTPDFERLLPLNLEGHPEPQALAALPPLQFERSNSVLSRGCEQGSTSGCTDEDDVYLKVLLNKQEKRASRMYQEADAALQRVYQQGDEPAAHSIYEADEKIRQGFSTEYADADVHLTRSLDALDERLKQMYSNTDDNTGLSPHNL